MSVQQQIYMNTIPYNQNSINNNQQNRQNLPKKQDQQSSSSTTKHFVKVLLSELDQQISIYNWRTKFQQQVIPIKNYQIISKGTIFNKHAIVKIQILSTNFTSLSYQQNNCLSTIINQLQSILEMLQYLVALYGTFQINQQNLFVSKSTNGLMIWPMGKYWINPTNTLYKNKGRNMGEKQMLGQLLLLLYQSSLKTSLLESFFEEIGLCETFEEVQKNIDCFGIKNCIFMYNFMRKSIKQKNSSILTSTATLSQTHLAFSNSPKKRKNINKQKYPFRSLQSLSKVQLPSNIIHKPSIYKSQILSSQYKNFIVHQGQRLREKNNGNIDRNYDNSKGDSLIKSQSFQDLQNELNYKNKLSQTVQIDKKTMLPLPATSPKQQNKQILLSEHTNNNQQTLPFQIIQKNGWKASLQSFNNTPIKQSICNHGFQQYIDHNNKNYKQLKLLNKFGREITKSYVPGLEEENQQ